MDRSTVEENRVQSHRIFYNAQQEQLEKRVCAAKERRFSHTRTHIHFIHGECRIFMHLSFLINNKIVCFHENMHKTRADDA